MDSLEGVLIENKSCAGERADSWVVRFRKLGRGFNNDDDEAEGGNGATGGMFEEPDGNDEGILPDEDCRIREGRD